MNVLMNLMVAVQIIAALVMIGLVLIQHGKGADMGASFGSGASGSLFGATGSANFLSRSTAACAAVFFICTLALAFFANDRARPSTGRLIALRRSSPIPIAPRATSGTVFASPITIGILDPQRDEPIELTRAGCTEVGSFAGRLVARLLRALGDASADPRVNG